MDHLGLGVSYWLFWRDLKDFTCDSMWCELGRKYLINVDYVDLCLSLAFLISMSIKKFERLIPLCDLMV